eukprot:962588-Pleurochrysis_carterae.AAC.1
MQGLPHHQYSEEKYNKCVNGARAANTTNRGRSALRALRRVASLASDSRAASAIVGARRLHVFTGSPALPAPSTRSKGPLGSSCFERISASLPASTESNSLFVHILCSRYVNSAVAGNMESAVDGFPVDDFVEAINSMLGAPLDDQSSALLASEEAGEVGLQDRMQKEHGSCMVSSAAESIRKATGAPHDAATVHGMGADESCGFVADREVEEVRTSAEADTGSMSGFESACAMDDAALLLEFASLSVSEHRELEQHLLAYSDGLSGGEELPDEPGDVDKAGGADGRVPVSATPRALEHVTVRGRAEAR